MDENTVFVSESDFPVQSTLEPTYLELEVLEINSISLVDTNLLVIDKHLEEPFQLFSLPELSKIASFGSRGEGPNEVLSPAYWGQYDKESLQLTVYDRRNFVISTIDLSLAVKGAYSLDKIIELPIDVGRDANGLMLNKEGRLIGTGYFSEGKYLFYDVENDSVGWSPFTPKLSRIPLKDEKTIGYLYASQVAIHPNNMHIISAFSYFKKIEIVDQYGKVLKIIQFENEQNIEDMKINPRGGMPLEIMTYFGNVFASENYIYTIYIGDKLWEKNNRSKKLFVLDWNGKLVANLDLATENIGSFIVDERTWQMIGINRGENQEAFPLVSFDLSRVMNRNPTP